VTLNLDVKVIEIYM